MKKLLLSTTLIIFIAGCSTDNETDVTKESTDDTTKKTEVKEVKVSPEKEIENDTRNDIGKIVTIDGIDFTVKSSQLTDERIEDHFESFEYVLELEVYYKNNTDKNFPAGRDVSVQVNDKEATYYDLDSSILQEIAPGEEITGKVYYAFNGTPEVVTAKFAPLLNTAGDFEEFNAYPELDL